MMKGINVNWVINKLPNYLSESRGSFREFSFTLSALFDLILL
jgi:hypothetical protein